MDALSAVNHNYTSAMDHGDKNQMKQEDFLKLLLAQLKLQNPLNPFDASTMMQQISQLTGLSAMQSMSDSVNQLKSSFGASQLLDASQMVGKSVQIASDVLNLVDETGASGSVLVPNGADSIQIAIRDNAGNVVKTLTLNPDGEGVLDFKWDGLDDNNQAVPKGFYKMSAVSSIGGNPVELGTGAVFKVNSVAFDKAIGKIILNVDGLGGVSMDNLIKIM